MIRLALRVRRADAELVLADLLELAPSGVEEIEVPAHDGGEGLVEYAVYGAPGEIPDLPDLRAAVGDALVEVSTSEVPDDWSERWKRFHKPVLVEAGGGDVHLSGDPAHTRGLSDGGGDVRSSDPPRGHTRARGPSDDGDVHPAHPARARVPSLHVRPPWEAPSDRSDALEIVIDPAQAFGTGAHATTRLCLELLLELAASERARGGVLDVGAGSGVLAIAAVKLGYGPVLALDNDRESVRAVLANAAVNDVRIDARRFDLRREELPWLAGNGDGDGVPAVLRTPVNSDQREHRSARTVVLANLLRPLLLELADTMPAPARGRRVEVIASGLLCEQADEVAQAFAERLGLRERARRERGEWAALWLSRD